MKFRSSVAGYVTGVRFYKGPLNTGMHEGHLWTSSGNLLASVTFPNETSSGWQQANFATPVAIKANTTYVISYWAPVGHYALDLGYFSASGKNNGPLQALQENGVYTYSKSTMPSATYQASNYWVDVVFSTVTLSAPTAVARTVISNNDSREGTSSQLRHSSQRTTLFSTDSASVASLSCLPSLVRAGDSFTCELELAGEDLSRTPTFEIASPSDDVRLPASVSARPGQKSIRFLGHVDSGTAQSVINIAVATSGNTAEAQITTLPFSAPVLSLPTTLLVKSGDPVSFFVTARDPSNLPVQIAASNLPSGAVFQPTSGRFEWTPAPSQAGGFDPVFTAINSVGFASSVRSKIEVGSGEPVIAMSPHVACSPGAIATLNGKWLSPTNDDLSDPTGASQRLGGTTVRVNGDRAPVVYSSSTRIDFQCPITTAGTELDISVATEAGMSIPLHAKMLAASPILLHGPSSNPKQGRIMLFGTHRLAAVREANGSGEPAKPGDLISILATGLGVAGTAASDIVVKVGGLDAQLQSVVPSPDAAGISVVIIRIPTAAPKGDEVPVQLELSSEAGSCLSSNVVTIAVE